MTSYYDHSPEWRIEMETALADTDAVRWTDRYLEHLEHVGCAPTRLVYARQVMAMRRVIADMKQEPS